MIPISVKLSLEIKSIVSAIDLAGLEPLCNAHEAAKKHRAFSGAEDRNERIPLSDIAIHFRTRVTNAIRDPVTRK